jgi:hypothetical protein
VVPLAVFDFGDREALQRTLSQQEFEPQLCEDLGGNLNGVAPRDDGLGLTDEASPSLAGCSSALTPPARRGFNSDNDAIARAGLVGP